MTRRKFCQSTATLALATGVLGFSSLSPFADMAFAAETVPTDELMKTDALPDMAIGNDKAPVTVIEYASMTCPQDRKSTRLNSSHVEISYAVFCLKKKK